MKMYLNNHPSNNFFCNENVCLLHPLHIFKYSYYKCFAVLDIWNILVVQSEQHVIYGLEAWGTRDAQADMEETDQK